jgi:Flp pilus assembly protein CpaB
MLVAAVSALSANATVSGAWIGVIIASADLPTGHSVEAGDLAVRKFPADVVPAVALREKGAVIGRTLAGPVARGEPITSTRLLSGQLTAGMPAGLVALPVTIRSAEFVQPGDRIDLLAAMAADSDQPAMAGGARRSETLAESVPVLAVLPGSDSDAGANTASVLVALTSAEAIRVAAAADQPVVAAIRR